MAAVQLRVALLKLRKPRHRPAVNRGRVAEVAALELRCLILKLRADAGDLFGVACVVCHHLP